MAEQDPSTMMLQAILVKEGQFPDRYDDCGTDHVIYRLEAASEELLVAGASEALDIYPYPDNPPCLYVIAKDLSAEVQAAFAERCAHDKRRREEAEENREALRIKERKETEEANLRKRLEALESGEELRLVRAKLSKLVEG